MDLIIGGGDRGLLEDVGVLGDESTPLVVMDAEVVLTCSGVGNRGMFRPSPGREGTFALNFCSKKSRAAPAPAPGRDTSEPTTAVLSIPRGRLGPCSSTRGGKRTISEMRSGVQLDHGVQSVWTFSRNDP